jgi:hypothetical protein
MTTATDTVTLSREEVLDAISALGAASNVLSALDGNQAGGGLESYFGEASIALRLAAFGALPEDDEGYETDPVNVETWARGWEKASEALRKLERPSPLERTLSDDQHYELMLLGSKFEKWAEVARESGSISGVEPGVATQ